MKKLLLILTGLILTYSGISQSVTTVSEGFESLGFPPSGWTDIGGTAPPLAWTRVSSGTNPTQAPHTGSGEARFNCFNIDPGETSTLASPVIDYSVTGCTFTKTVSLWMYRDNGYSGYGDSLSIYINTTASLAGATYINRIARSRSIAQPVTQASTGWYQYTFNIPGGFTGATNYLLFKATSQYGNNIFIDDVSWNFCQSGCSGAPSAGTITAPASACSGVNFNLSVTGATIDAGMKYSWQSSPDGVGSWTNLNNTSILANPYATSQTAVTYYRLVDTCISSGLSAISSNVVSVTMNAPTACYCLPTYSSGCSNDNIATDSLGTLQDIGLTCTPIYEDRTLLQPGTLAIPSINAGTSVTLKITFGSDGNQYNGVWIDFNQNGIFEASEYFTSATNAGSNGTAYVTIAIPPTALAGNTRMRIRGGDDSQPTSGQACGAAVSNFGTARDYLVNIIAASGCSGTPSAPIVAGPTTACPGINFTLTASGYPVASGVNYAWQSSSSAGGPWTNIPGQTSPASATLTQSVDTYYRLVDTCTNGGGTNISNVWNVTMAVSGCPPTNDDCSGAITVGIQPFNATCSGTTSVVTTLATLSSNTSVCWSSSNNDDVWYRFVATNSVLNIRVSNFVVTSGTATDLAFVIYDDNNNCSNVNSSTELTTACPVIAAGSGSGLGSFSGLIVGRTYTLRLFTSGSANSASFNFCLMAPAPPPGCVTNISPANGATGVTIAPNTPISWNAEPNATSYDVYFGTVNPPTTLIGNTVATTVNITGLGYGTTYYWYIVPKNATGPATGCSANTTSFTTIAAPVNCVPLTSTGCTLGDRLDLFRIKGAGSELNIATTSCQANAYTDSTDHPTTITLVTGESFWGQATAATSGDYLTLWIDANDNGFFENSERVMNNLLLNDATPTNFTLYVPLTTALGTHRLRARLVYYGTTTPPTAVTDPCAAYTYSDTKDFLVTISNVGSTHNVSTFAGGSCYFGGGDIIIDSASNNNGTSPVFITDSLNNYIAGIYPNGNNLGRVHGGYYKNIGPVRQDPQGIYYLDRNITIKVEKQPTFAYNARLFFLTSELNALIAQPGSGVTSIFDLNMTKNGDNCQPAVVLAGTLHSPTGFGSLLGDRFLDFTGLTSFSSNYLHGGATPVPVTLLGFTATRTGKVNQLNWSTSQEMNASHFVVERSNDARNYSPIGQVTAVGNSSITTTYNFTDNHPVTGINYYRLQLVDKDNKYKYSPVRSVRNEGTADVAVYPNPVKDVMTVNITADKSGTGTLLITDISGKRIYSNKISVTQGANNILVNLGNVANGSYLIKVQLNDDMIVKKFEKL